MKTIATLLGLFSFSLQAMAICHELEIGQSLKVTSKESSSGLSQNYTLKRVSTNSWQTFINLSIDSSHSTKRETRKMRNKIEKCFSQFEDYLIDEKNRKIELVLYDKNLHKEVKAPNPVTIYLRPSGSRSTATRWAQDINCGVIVHESFHLLGLVDEYFEPVMTEGDDLAYKCRHLGPKDSIMRNTKVSMFYWKNILFSAHVDSIIYPECKSINEKYYNCSKNAYRSNSCSESFSDCYDKSWVIN